MKHRKEVPLKEVLAVIDVRIEDVKGMRNYVLTNRARMNAECPGVVQRKLNQLRMERFYFTTLRRQVAFLRYVRETK